MKLNYIYPNKFQKRWKFERVYKCNICGNIVELVHVGGGVLVCCGENMHLLKVNTVDASPEKHVPVIEKTNSGILVKVGSLPHPMIDAHYIEWIEIIIGEKVFRKYLKPGDLPQAEFPVKDENIIAREYCNLHGLWQNK